MNKQPLAHQARKRFGQNFLVDQGIIQRIITYIGPRKIDNLIEIGPGKGAITEGLLAVCPDLQVVELDRDLIPLLQTQFARYTDFKIHRADALKFDFSTLVTEDTHNHTGDTKNNTLRIVGNLPYNISTPLIFHLLRFQQYIEDMHFMLQKEVVQRLCAQPGNKTYGRLSIMVQYHCRVETLFEVPPESFQPAPKVDSAIVRLTPHATPPAPAKNVQTLAHIVGIAFQQRRKTLRNALKQLIPSNTIEKLNIDPNLRPENLTLEDFVRLSDSVANSLPEHLPK